MKLFSDEYLMHYGIKGMKWKKKKAKTPGEYLEEAYEEQGVTYNHQDPRDRREHRNATYVPHYANPSLKYMPKNHIAYKYDRHRKARKAEALADSRRNADLKKARKKAYKKNQRRIAKQQLKNKLLNKYSKLTSSGHVTVTHDTHITGAGGVRR